MKIYHYHPDTKVFLGEGLADKSPLEYNVWLIPAYATTECPPECVDDQVAIKTKNGWAVTTKSKVPVAPQPSAVEPESLTPEQKLASTGLTVEELKSLLGIE